MWYDAFAPFYDLAVERIYRPYRPTIADALSLDAGDCVIDLACGTGQNFAELVERVGERGEVIGLDASGGMLARARRRCERLGLANVRLVQADARHATAAQIFGDHPERRAKAVVCTLGFSALPDWQDVLAQAFSWVERAGRVVIFDIFAERWVPQTAIVSWVAKADLDRQSWKVLETLAGDVDVEFLSGSPHVHGGRPFLAVAQRGDEWETGEVAAAVAAARAAVQETKPAPPASAERESRERHVSQEESP